MITQSQIRIFIITLGLLLGLNLWFWQIQIIGSILGIIFTITISYILGNKFIKSNSLINTLLGLIILISYLSVLGSIFYLIIGLYLPIILTMLIGVIVFGYFYATNIELPLVKIKFDWTILVYSTLTAICLFILYQSRTSEAIRSTWEVVPISFWITLILTTGVLVWREINRGHSLILITIHSLLLLNVASIVYVPGFGYDPFIHLATEKYIAINGFITPKKLYYIGMYSPIIFWHHLTLMPLEIINKWLVPILAGLTLPAAMSLLLSKHQKIYLTLGVLAVPFTTFIITTPQNLANLFLLLIVILILAQTKPTVIWLLALAALITQPLAGIPALTLASFYQSIKLNNQPISQIFKFSGLIIGFFGILGALGLLSIISPFHPTLAWSAPLLSLFLPLITSFKITTQPILDAIYLYSSLLWPAVLIISLFGFIKYWRVDKNLKIISWLVITLFFNAILISSAIKFDFLIGYERLDFAKRFIEMALIVLTSVALVTLVNLKITDKIYQSTIIILLGLILPASLYLSQPRNDKHFYTRGFNISQADFAAVSKIKQDAQNKKYVVLSNQNLGAAALVVSGFSPHYFAPDGSEQYFYSIPTGGYLYKYFYQIAELGGDVKTNVDEIFKTIPVDYIYLAIHDYWFNKEKIITSTTQLNNQKLIATDENITVIRFEK
ncbi:MAG: hypothetical protein AAB657_03635 [Patescibacteria group bacterium]